MQIFATFEHSIFVELALASLEKLDIGKENILAVSLNNRMEERRLFDTIHRADGVSLFDTGAALAVAFSVIGTSIGFVLEWGPIFWGLIAGFSGFFLGVSINVLYYKVFRKRKRLLKGKKSEVIMVINCHPGQSEKIEEILWNHEATGIAKL